MFNASDLALLWLFVSGVIGLLAVVSSAAPALLALPPAVKRRSDPEGSRALLEVRLALCESVLVGLAGFGLLIPWMAAMPSPIPLLRTEPMQAVGKALLLLFPVPVLVGAFRLYRGFRALYRALRERTRVER